MFAVEIYAAVRRFVFVEGKSRREAARVAIIDSQSVKSAEKGGPASIRTAMMRARRSRARSGIFL